MPSVFVTGASRGLGFEFVRQYAAAGWSVTASCRNPGEAQALAALGVETVTLDLADTGSITRAAASRFGEDRCGRPPCDGDAGREYRRNAARDR
jgi:NAD(P)-dependent dehydrogenase (short-subunit alcohol dehydrogenase family)